MKVKRKVIRLIEQLQAGTIRPADKDRLEQLVKDNAELQSLIETDRTLKTVPRLFADPGPEKLSELRARVMRQIRQLPDKKTSGINRLIENFHNMLRRPEMALAALALIAGFFLGRIFPSETESLNSEIISQINKLARQHSKLEDVQNSPYVYSNISFKEMDNEEISLSFDVTTHLDMLAKKDDPLIRDVIAQALVNPENVGSELKAISYSQGRTDRKLKEALIYSVQSAPVMAVRLKALDGLQVFKKDHDVQNALLNVLREEESVKMRLLALDFLTEMGVSPDTIQLALSEATASKNPAVMIKVRKYIKQF